jgi:hypothetical protein
MDVLHDLSKVDGLDILVNNQVMGGDPCEGRNKELVVEYAVDSGPVITVRKKKHEHLQIP